MYSFPRQDRFKQCPVLKSAQIFVTLSVSNANGERSFSALKRVKNFLRTSMAQDKLSNFAILTIEPEITKNLQVSDILEKFASVKARRKAFLFVDYLF